VPDLMIRRVTKTVFLVEQNWILKEAMKSRQSGDVVILEKPDVKRYLNGLLKKRFWPVIHSSLEASDYVYAPESKPKTEWEESQYLTRSLIFILSEIPKQVRNDRE